MLHVEKLDLKDAVFTMDALHCKKTLNKIVSGGNHYTVRVKGNQPKLKAAIEPTITNDNPADYYRDEAITCGRPEIRETYLYARQNNLDKGWGSIRLTACVHRNFLSKNREHKTDSFYVSDPKTTDAKRIAEGIRSHRHTGNRLHYTKDAVMRENVECTKNRDAVASLALFSDFAFNIMKLGLMVKRYDSIH